MISSIACTADYRFLLLATRSTLCLVDVEKGTILTERQVKSDRAPIRHIAITETHVAAVGDDKILRVWRVPEVELLAERTVPKRANALKFSPDSKQILVGDKFGDVFAFDIEDFPEQSKIPVKDLQPALGHVSMLTDFTFVDGTSYIATCDRDEHVRISNWPRAFDVHGFCFGHTKFVASLCNHRNRLLSAGADPYIFVWDPQTAQLVSKIDISGCRQYASTETTKSQQKKNTSKRKRFVPGSEDAPSKKSQGKSRHKKAKAAPSSENMVIESPPLHEEPAEEADDDSVMETQEKPIAIHQMVPMSDNAVLFISSGASCIGVFNPAQPEKAVDFLDLSHSVTHLCKIAADLVLAVLATANDSHDYRLLQLADSKLAVLETHPILSLLSSLTIEDLPTTPTLEELYPALYLGRKEFGDDEV